MITVELARVSDNPEQHAFEFAFLLDVVSYRAHALLSILIT